MGDQPNGQTQPLTARIADALNSNSTSLPELRSLLQEVKETYAAAKQSAAAEGKAALDPANVYPMRSECSLRRAQRTIARLDAALPPLEAKVKQIEQAEFRVAWHLKADELAAQRDALAEELRDVYPSFLQVITDLFRDIDANTGEINKLHMSAPIGESRRLIDAELRARGLAHYDAAHPRLRDNLRLPNFDVSRTIQFPQNVDWSAQAALAGEAMARRMKEKYGTSCNADWAAARDLALQQEHAEHTRREEQLKVQQAADKAAYEAKLRQMK